MNAGALFEGEALTFGRRTLAHGSREIQVIAHEHAFTSSETVRWIDDLSDLLIRPRAAAIDVVVFFPEATLELQSDFPRAVVGGRGNRRLHWLRKVLLNSTQYRQGNRGHAVVGIGAFELSVRIGIDHPHAALALADFADRRAIHNPVPQSRGEGRGQAVHPPDDL